MHTNNNVTLLKAENNRILIDPDVKEFGYKHEFDYQIVLINNHSMLRINYPKHIQNNIKNNQNDNTINFLKQEDVFNYIFDELDKLYNIYEKINHLIIDDDALNELPSNIKFEFKLLSCLEINGTRMWNFHCGQVPLSIQKLDLIGCGNLLHEHCFSDIEQLKHLVEIAIPVDCIQDLIESKQYNFSFPNHENLKRIVIFPGKIDQEFEFSENLKIRLLESHFFKNIRHRINSNSMIWTLYGSSRYDAAVVELADGAATCASNTSRGTAPLIHKTN